MTDHTRAAEDQQLHALLGEAVKIVDAEEGSVLLLTEDGEALEFVISHSPVAATLRGMRQPLGKGITGLAFTLQQPMAVNDVSHDSSFDPTVQDRTRVRTRSIMVVPLVSPEGEFGALTAINSRRTEGFTAQALSSYGEAARLITERLTVLQPTPLSSSDAGPAA